MDVECASALSQPGESGMSLLVTLCHVHCGQHDIVCVSAQPGRIQQTWQKPPVGTVSYRIWGESSIHQGAEIGLKSVPWVIEECQDKMVRPEHEYLALGGSTQFLRQPAHLYLSNLFSFLF